VERHLYAERFYDDRYYTDYYHRLGVVEGGGRKSQRQPAQPEELHKLAVSWNLGLGDYRTFAKWGRRLRIFWPWASYRVKATPVGADRDIDVSYRASSRYNVAAVSFQRQETRRQLMKLAADGEYSVVCGGKIPYRQYREEMGRTLIVPSPFGLGEVCYRDFECFLAGATLFKPDMSHLETWPNYYEDGITYVSHAWDFSDFQSKLTELLDCPAMRQRIAQAGQDRYLNSLSPVGGEAFAKHFAALIRKAIDNAPS